MRLTTYRDMTTIRVPLSHPIPPKKNHQSLYLENSWHKTNNYAKFCVGVKIWEVIRLAPQWGRGRGSHALQDVMRLVCAWQQGSNRQTTDWRRLELWPYANPIFKNNANRLTRYQKKLLSAFHSVYKGALCRSVQDCVIKRHDQNHCTGAQRVHM